MLLATHALHPAAILSPRVNLAINCTGAETGRCFQHALACGGGTALFLLLRNTRVLALHGSRAALLPSPYVDAHGEEDLGLRRGRCVCRAKGLVWKPTASLCILVMLMMSQTEADTV